MPSSTKLIIRPLHPTFTAEVEGVDWSKPIDEDTFAQIKDAIYKVITYSTFKVTCSH